MKLLFYPTALALLAALPLASQAQTTGGVRIGTAGTPDVSAVLDLSSTSKGLLPPRLSQAQRDAINPAASAAGLVIFNTSTGTLNTWDGTRWVAALADTSPVMATFAYTGAPQTFMVPVGVTSLTVDMAGAAGAAFNSLNINAGDGLGGRVQATLRVSAGQTLTIVVGRAGDRATSSTVYNGGGAGSFPGGGATDIRTGGTTLADRVLVAGGGGGSTSAAIAGGVGGGLVGGAGANSMSGTGGGGGTQSAGGAGAVAGTSGTGGSSSSSSGAGGGGYYGGGSGTNGGGGGGGSSYAGAGTGSVVHTPGYQRGNGYVRLISTPPATLPTPYLDASNIVGVIRNQTTQQAGSSFNISGDGTVGGDNNVAGDSNIGGSSLVAGNTVVDAAGANQGSFANSLRFGGALSGEGIGSARTSSSDNQYGLDFYTASVKRLLITVSGNVGIGNVAPAYPLDVAGQVRATNVSVSSDARFKTEVRPLTGALAGVLALRGVRYRWNELGVQHGGTAGAGQVGVLAQELEKVYPELVLTDAQGYKSVNYAQLTPVLLEAIKELKSQLDECSQRAARAEARQQQAQAAQLADHADLQTLKQQLARLAAAAPGPAQALSH